MPRVHFCRRYPTFSGSEDLDKPQWETSVFYWWWCYLKRHEGYLQTCAASGKGEFASLYEDFGDVRSDDFRSWWSGGRGARLFGEPSIDAFKVRVLKKGDVVEDDDSEFLTVRFPLSIPKKHLLSRFRRILKEVPDPYFQRGEKGHRWSVAKYRIDGGEPSVRALKIGLLVWDYHQAHPEYTLWEVGNQIPEVYKNNKIFGTESEEEVKRKKNFLAASVSRYLRKTRQSIENAAYGDFPKGPD